MRGSRAWALVAWAALALGEAGCDGRGKEKEEEAKAAAARQAEATRQAEDARREAERAQKLAEAFKTIEAQPMGEERRTQFATMRKLSPAKYHADLEEVRKCHVDRLGQALEAGRQGRYSEVAAPAAECLGSMSTLYSRRLTSLIESLASDATTPSEREQKIDNALTELATSTLQMASELLRLLLDYGPTEVRVATFEAVAAKLPGADGDVRHAHALLQRGYANENVIASKERMAARLKELGIPLEPPKPSPAPPAKPVAGS